jgi:hypothetical protein
MDFEHEIGNLLQRVAAAHHMLNAGRRPPAFLKPEIELLFGDLAAFVEAQWPDRTQRDRVVELVRQGATLRHRMSDGNAALELR